MMKKIYCWLPLLLLLLPCLGGAVSADQAEAIEVFCRGKAAESFRAGDVLDVTYQRPAGYTDEATLVVACYNTKGQLMKVESAGDTTGGKQQLSVVMDTVIDGEACSNMRVMLISNFATLQPLSLPRELSETESVFYHPVYTVAETERDIAKLTIYAQTVMSMSDEQIKAVIPKQTPISSLKNPVTKEAVTASWNPFQPDVVTDKKTQAVFPNETIQNNHTEVFTNLRGKEITVSSYQDGEGTLYYIDAFVDYQKQEWLRKQLSWLSTLYYLTGDEQYAYKTALILSEWANDSPDYLLLTNPIRYPEKTYVNPEKQGWDAEGNPLYGSQPYGWYDSRNGKRWQTNIDDVLLQAYDLTYYSHAYEELGDGVREHVEDDLLAEHADFVLLQPFYRPTGTSLLRDNLIQFVRGFVSTGRVLERPEYVHYAYQYCTMMAEYMTFTRDSFWVEGSSYFNTLNANLGDAYERFIGYTDPPGYVSDITGKHITDAYQELKRERLFFRKGYDEVGLRLINPMGVGSFMHDSWSLNMTQAPAEPLTTSKSVLLDGFGEAILGAGSGADQLQTRLHFSEDRLSHAHGDMLNLTLTAFGRYDMDDIGYHAGNYRHWTVSNLSHNTVVVDRNQAESLGALGIYKAKQKGNVTLYDTDAVTPLIQVDDNGAPGRPALFRRTVAQNSMDEKHPYVIDVFEVSGGGQTHDYVLHGTRFMQQNAVTNADVSKMEGERPLLEGAEVWKEPEKSMEVVAGNGYGVFTNVWAKDQLQNDFYVDFQYGNPYEAVNEGDASPVYVTDERVRERWAASGETMPVAGMRAHFVLDDKTDADTTLYIGDTPSIKLESLYSDEPPQTKQAKSLILRRRSNSDGLSSKFITVLEPYEYSRDIQEVRQLVVENGKNAVALKIGMPDREDIVLIALDGGLGEICVTDNGKRYATDGRYAVISSRGGRVSYHLYGGSSISIDGVRVYSSADGVLSGEVLSIASGRDSDDVVQVRGTVPNTAAGKYLFVNFAECLGVDETKLADIGLAGRKNASFVYLIDRVVQNEDGTSSVYLAEESGIREAVGDGGEKTYVECFYNWRMFSSEAEYTIY